MFTGDLVGKNNDDDVQGNKRHWSIARVHTTGRTSVAAVNEADDVEQ